MMKINKFYNSTTSHGDKARNRNVKTLDCSPKGFYPKPAPLKHGGKVDY